MTDIQENIVYSLTDNWLEVFLRSVERLPQQIEIARQEFESATSEVRRIRIELECVLKNAQSTQEQLAYEQTKYDKAQKRAEDARQMLEKTEEYVRDKPKEGIERVEKVLDSGGYCPDDARQWYKRGLKNLIAEKNLHSAFGISRPNHRPHKKHTYVYAVEAKALCLLGITPPKAAEIVLELYCDVVTKPKTITDALKSLDSGIGLFNGLKKAYLQATKNIYDPKLSPYLPEELKPPYCEVDKSILNKCDPESQKLWANAYKRIDETEKSKGRYIKSEQIRIPPESPDKILDGDYDVVSIELCFPMDCEGIIISQKLLDMARKELRPDKKGRSKRGRPSA
jgi:ElaB/YqjD/DUF883 family membrane-anchored ribosome-binding protein